MNPTPYGRLAIAVFGGLLGLGAVAAAQTVDFLVQESAVGPVVRDAPYSAESVTTFTQTLGDGTRIERQLTGKVYRDRAGRVRREQTISGLAALDPGRDSQPLVTIVDPVAGASYVLDSSRRVAQRTVIGNRALMGQPPPPPPPPPLPAGGVTDPAAPPPPPSAPGRPAEEALGTRSFGDLTVVGRRTRMRIPPGEIGNDRPIDVTTERWESRDLRVVVLLRHDDPRTGRVTYRLTEIKRGDPSPDLFSVPAGYAVVDTSASPRRDQ
jgi:hypothetical protein